MMALVPIAATVRTYLFRRLIGVRRHWLRSIWGMTIGDGSEISFSARLDKTNPKGVFIGDYTAVTFDSVILTHDAVNNVDRDVKIGSYCLIGARSFIYPGVTIGDQCIVAAASVVMKDVPSNCVVSGNPARIVETNIRTGKLGRRLSSFSAAKAAPANVTLLDIGKR